MISNITNPSRIKNRAPLLSRIRAKIHQTTSKLRRTKRRVSAYDSPASSSLPSVNVAPAPSTSVAGPSYIFPDAAVTLNPMLATVTEAWWLGNPHSQPTYSSASATIPASLISEDVGGVLSPLGGFPALRYLDGAELSSPTLNTPSFQERPSAFTTFPPALDAVYPTQSNDAVLSPLSITTDVADVPDDNDYLPYYGSILIPLPSSNQTSPGEETVTSSLVPIKLLSCASLPENSSLRHAIEGRNLYVSIYNPSPSDSHMDARAHDDIAVDSIFKDMAYKSPQLAHINVEVAPPCGDVAYGGKLINDTLFVLQGCLLSPHTITIRLPLETTTSPDTAATLLFPANAPVQQDRPTPRAVSREYAPLKDFDRIPPLAPWWRLGRMSTSQLRCLSLSYPLPLDDFLEILSCGPALEEVAVDRLVRSQASTPKCAFPVLEHLTSLSVVSDVGLKSIFDSVTMSGLRYLKLVVTGDATPNAYDILWNLLEQVDITCGMTCEVENDLRLLCTDSIWEDRIVKISNIYYY